MKRLEQEQYIGFLAFGLASRALQRPTAKTSIAFPMTQNQNPAPFKLQRGDVTIKWKREDKNKFEGLEIE